MARVEDLAAMASAALHLPGVLLRRSCVSARHGAGSKQPPVVLIHGYAGTDAVWSPLVRGLSDAGFGHIVTLSYNPFVNDVPQLAAEVAGIARETMRRTGHDSVSFVGHSLGGLVARCAVQLHGMGPSTRTVVTIATPHSGAPFAKLGYGPCARRMHPGSSLYAALCGPGASGATRWTAFYSDQDRVVPPWSARITDPRLDADNVLVPGRGHLTICRDRGLVEAVVARLLDLPIARSETALAA